LETNIAVFRGKEIRKTIYKNEWWFSIVDVIEVLTGTERPRKYWNDLKNKLSEEGYSELSEKIGQLNRTRIIYQMVLSVESFWSVVSFVISGSSRYFAVATMILSCSSGRFLSSSIVSRTG